jgi:ubiquinone/menaquinone biosynthesis C-methylase UbiE
MTDFAGNYPIELRKGEIERLLVQSEAMAPETEAMLDRLGSMQGWSCLDIGCGPGGITGLLSERVGSAGCVMGIDTDARFLEYARKTAPANVEFRLANAFGSDLPEASFDFVHMRFVASTSGQPEMLLREAIRLAKPGGIVALQEPDGSTLNCFPPHKSWDTLKEIYIAVFKGVSPRMSNRVAGRSIPNVGAGSAAWRPHDRLSAINRGIASRNDHST